MSAPPQAALPVHVSNSLLSHLSQHTTIDIDTNIASIAVQHNVAYRGRIEEARSAETSGDGVAPSLFGDMTSNQLIVQGVILDLQQADATKAEQLFHDAIRAAEQIIGEKTYKGLALNETWQARLAIVDGGLENENGPEEALEQLAVDILTVRIGLEMLPNLLSDGSLHAQTVPSLAYDSRGTVAHARRFVALYELLSDSTVGSDRICIKIPSTVAGIAAIRYLESGGCLDESGLGGPIPEGAIKTLGTTVFAVKQGIAVAQAGRARYIAPYINALAAHFFEVDQPGQQDRTRAVEAGALSIGEIVFPLQRCLSRLRAESESKADGSRIPTLTMAASFLQPSEAVRLCGLDHVTLGASILDALSATAADEAAIHTMKAALAACQVDDAQVEQELIRYGAREAEKEAESFGSGGWLHKGSASNARLNRALEDQRVSYMLKDALDRFQGAERNLRKMVRDRRQTAA